MNELKFALGNIDNVLKRIGEYKSNLFCFGNDPITKSGVIVSKGEIISSRILDITLKSGGKGADVLSYSNNLLNTVEVKYLDKYTKTLETIEFNILSDEALIEVIKIITKNKELHENIKKIEKNEAKTIEKLEKIESFLSKNSDQIESIENIKKDIVDINSKIEFIIKNMN